MARRGEGGILFELGELDAVAGDKGAANARFQKVYLSFGAYKEYAAKAYLRSADMLLADGQADAATETLRLLIRNPKFSDTPEAKEASKRLKE